MINKKAIYKKAVPILIGMILGYAYYYFIGCSSGSCPITSNPYISTIYGGFAGALISFSNKKKEEQKSESKS
ncbi:MAG: DUF6132 family protein [bacterium]